MTLPGPSPPNLPPVPPSALISRVGAGDWLPFHKGGWQSVQALQQEVALFGREFSDFERILEFGCGPGRVMRHLGYLGDRCELYGADIDSDMIAWCAEHIPFAEFRTISPEPPLPYAPASFDLIFSCGGFTNLNDHRQDLWQGELRKLLAPDGIALLAVPLVVPPVEHLPQNYLPESWKGYTHHRSWPIPGDKPAL